MASKKNHSTGFTNEELHRGLVNGSPVVIEYIYRQNFAAVKNMVMQNSGTESDAKDLYQEAFLATWLAAVDGKYQPKAGTGPQAYLYQVARHKWLDKLKSVQYRKTIRLNGEHLRKEGVEDERDDQAKDDRLVHLLDLYHRLDEKCRGLLDRFYFENKSMKEISLETNYDADSLRTMKYRCMQKLRKWHRDLSKANKETDEQF